MNTHILSAILAPAALAVTASPSFKLEYVHNLATTAGELRASAMRLSYDPLLEEIYAVGYGAVRVYNLRGVETFRFGDDAALGKVHAVAGLENGDLMVLAIRENRMDLVRCNFRGEPLELVTLTGLPAELGEFAPAAIAYAQGRLYLADLLNLKVAVVTLQGAHLASYDLAAMLQVEDRRQEHALNAFSVDSRGNLLFTIAPIFKAFVVSPGGEVRSFGKAGSAPGNFGVVAGIGSDDEGRIYLADTLKCAVMVFDPNFRFLGEFGGRGRKPGELISPTSLAVTRNAVYVSQDGDRGVAAYRIRGG